MAGICEGRVVIVTGAGRGLGRAHALEFARQGAKLVINDVGSELDGTGTSSGPANDVVNEIRALGGEAVANGDDVADWEGSARIIQQAIDTYGDLHVLVNNAGILRDRMLINLGPGEWDAVIRVHLRGLFCMSQHAAVYWRNQSKEGKAVDARIINTTSPAGLYSSVGQTNYGAAKGGIANFTVNAALELKRYGITVNCISPSARTRMTATIPRPGTPRPQEPSDFDLADPANASPLVVWLASSEARDVTGRVFNIRGGDVSVAEGWAPGPKAHKPARWEASELGPVVHDLVAKARPLLSPRGEPITE